MEPSIRSRAGGLSLDRHDADIKFWPSVGRIDNVHGDRNLVCSCVGMEAYSAVENLSSTDQYECTTRHPLAPKTKSLVMYTLPACVVKCVSVMQVELDPEFHPNMGKGMDLWVCQFLEVDYDALT